MKVFSICQTITGSKCLMEMWVKCTATAAQCSLSTHHASNCSCLRQCSLVFMLFTFLMEEWVKFTVTAAQCSLSTHHASNCSCVRVCLLVLTPFALQVVVQWLWTVIWTMRSVVVEGGQGWPATITVIPAQHVQVIGPDKHNSHWNLWQK